MVVDIIDKELLCLQVIHVMSEPPTQQESESLAFRNRCHKV